MSKLSDRTKLTSALINKRVETLVPRFEFWRDAYRKLADDFEAALRVDPESHLKFIRQTNRLTLEPLIENGRLFTQEVPSVLFWINDGTNAYRFKMKLVPGDFRVIGLAGTAKIMREDRTVLTIYLTPAGWTWREPRGFLYDKKWSEEDKMLHEAEDFHEMLIEALERGLRDDLQYVDAGYPENVGHHE